MEYYLIVFLPLLGALLAWPAGKAFGPKAAEYLTCLFMVIAATLSVIEFYNIAGLSDGHPKQEVIQIATWMSSGAFTVDWALRIDTLTAVMLVVVNVVSCLVHIYSIGYMHHDPHRPRFFAYLSFFTFAMLMLVTSDNMLQMFFGWEGVGVASYLLIGFWFHKDSANAASIKAFVVNRVGDFGFALGVMATFVWFGTVNFTEIFEMLAVHGDEIPEKAAGTFMFLGYELHAMTVICLLLFMGAMGKSAQILLHTWLPDAMEGPTPVSALIHAATMVTAGVFLVCRLSPMFEYAPIALATVTVIGATTAFFAATVGLFQNDIKRVIAYSTCSQLGYMFFAAGVSAYNVAIFHLFTHAFFKALLFLGAGSVIHAMSDEQDMRNMGGIYKMIPLTWGAMLVGTFALTGVGIPGTYFGFAGFFSKDAVLEVAYAAGTGVGEYAFWLGLFAAVMTSFYSWRLAYMSFHGKPRASREVMSHVHESPPVMLVPLAILAFGAVFAGVWGYGHFFGHHLHDFWGDSIFIRENVHHAVHDAHNIKDFAYWVIWTPLIAMLIGLCLATYYFFLHPEKAAAMAAKKGALYTFFKNKWYWDELYDVIFVRNAQRLGTFLWKKGDGWLIDGFGPDGVSATVLNATKRIVRLQSGYVYHYAFAMMIGVAALITWYSFFAGQGGAH